MLRPCRAATAGSNGLGQPAYFAWSGSIFEARAGYRLLTVLPRVSTRWRPLPGFIPLASIHSLFGTRPTSSGFSTLQMMLSPPDGAQESGSEPVCADSDESDPQPTTATPSRALIRRMNTRFNCPALSYFPCLRRL